MAHRAAPRRKEQASGPGDKRVRSGEDLDVIIGFLGFWTVVLLVVTVWMELTAQPALGWALGLLAILLRCTG